MKKRMLALVTAVLFLLLMTVGCRNTTPDTSDDGVTASSTSTTFGSTDADGNTDVSSDPDASDVSAPEASDVTAENDANSTPDNDVSGTMTGSGGNKTTTSGKSTTTTKQGPSSDKHKTTIKFGTGYYNGWYDAPVGKDPYADLMRDVFSTVEKKYGITIDCTPLSTINMDIIARTILSGDEPYDIMELSLEGARRLAVANVLYDQSSLSTLDLAGSHFSASSAFCEALNYNGKVYASTYGYPYGSIGGVFVNTTLLNQNKQEDVEKLYKNGDWTWDKFRQIAINVTRDTNGDGITDIWGIVADTQIVGFAITSNAKGTVIRENGKYVVGMANENGLEALTWVQQLYAKDKCYNYVTSGNVFDSFVAGNAAFYISALEVLQNLTAMEDEITFLPFPKGPKQKEHYNGTYGGRLFVMPQSLSDAEFVGKVYNEIAKEANDALYDVFEEKMLDYGLSESGAEIALGLTKYLHPEYSTCVDSSKFHTPVTNAIYSSNGDPANKMLSLKTVFEKAVADYYG